MAIVLELKGLRKSHEHKKTGIRQSIVMMEKSSNGRVKGPPGVNISDDFGGVTVPGSKSLALVKNNALSRGGGWRQLLQPMHL